MRCLYKGFVLASICWTSIIIIYVVHITNIDNKNEDDAKRNIFRVYMTKTTTNNSYTIKNLPEPMPDFDLDTLAIIRSDADVKLRDDGYRRYAFNLLISDRIGERREISDTRHHLFVVFILKAIFIYIYQMSGDRLSITIAKIEHHNLLL